ncbi:Succinate dehydrogenase cytochrome b560 subunit [Apostasia shenzhenica]|uniref:Succinate dehydrogenase cytochrome b560 subunit n=1 Tax=Apostasia shenzhenica TaxID=1088818 RepID=A0A2H9ZSZ1_9ASPA|nr:Succinate dehydrogenase cytochrome b560 subunit [Apostasia shenzhenica]
MDIPVALRGLLNGNQPNSKNGLRQLPSNIEQLAELKSNKSFSSGSRAFHGSRTVSDSAKGAFFNRPLSPHLPLKKPQLSATYSISHRIFGAGIASAILLIPLTMKFTTLFYA